MLQELFKSKHEAESTIATSKLPLVGFDKQTGRKSMVNVQENPHEKRFKNINRFPSILSTNKRTDCMVSWDKSRKSVPGRSSKVSHDWLVNQVAKKKKGHIHKFKKKDLMKQNMNHLLL